MRYTRLHKHAFYKDVTAQHDSTINIFTQYGNSQVINMCTRSTSVELRTSTNPMTVLYYGMLIISAWLRKVANAQVNIKHVGSILCTWYQRGHRQYLMCRSTLNTLTECNAHDISVGTGRIYCSSQH